MSRLTRAAISAAAGPLGWRLVLGTVRTTVAVPSLAAGAELAARLAALPGADGHLSADLRSDRLHLSLTTPQQSWPAPADLDLAAAISAELAGLALEPLAGAGRAVQTVEIAVDALDIPAVRPFWQAVLGYVPDPAEPGPDGALLDPLGQGPAVWFQQMDQPRPQRNRIHFDVAVPHDEAAARIEQTLAAGGVMVSAESAPRFWVLADREGNEVCVTTWQARDPEAERA
jgi:4a-hydroxytetrahydrobiopterin dehydratase